MLIQTKNSVYEITPPVTQKNWLVRKMRASSISEALEELKVERRDNHAIVWQYRGVRAELEIGEPFLLKDRGEEILRTSKVKRVR